MFVWSVGFIFAALIPGAIWIGIFFARSSESEEQDDLEFETIQQRCDRSAR
jgi:hypothetical protein